MSSIIEQLGLDPESLRWYQLGACAGSDVNLFYDNYESDRIIATQIDEMCLHCPVISQCYNEGVSNKERGVWGGVYLNLGRVDVEHNSHKTEDTWTRLKDAHGTSDV
jgi:hypothetical protein